MFKKNEEVDFFELFTISGGYICEAANKLLDLVKNFSDVEQKVAEIKEIEHKGDHQAHTVYKELNKAFITPLEREDILNLNYNIDNVLDNIEETATYLLMFNVKSIELNIIPFAELVVKISNSLESTLKELKNFKKSKTLMDKIIEINTIEEEGDRFFASAVKELFSSGKDPLHIMKWYEIYKELEKCLDDCESVSNVIEDVILKNS